MEALEEVSAAREHGAAVGSVPLPWNSYPCAVALPLSHRPPSVPSSPSSLPSHPPPPFSVPLPFSLSTPQRLATLNWYHHPEHCPRRKRCCHLTTRISNSTVRCTPTPHWAQHLLEFWWHLHLQHYYLKLMWRPFLQDLLKWDKARAAVGRQGLCLQAVKIVGFEAFSCPVDLVPFWERNTVKAFFLIKNIFFRLGHLFRDLEVSPSIVLENGKEFCPECQVSLLALIIFFFFFW